LPTTTSSEFKHPLSCAWRYSAIAVVIASIVGVIWLTSNDVRLSQQVPIHAIEPEIGHAFRAFLPPWPLHVEPDSAIAPTASKAVLREDGRLLGPAHALHDDIRKVGKGRFSHWNNSRWVYFSTSDNSDPRVNGRSYTVETLGRLSKGAALSALVVLASLLFGLRRNGWIERAYRFVAELSRTAKLDGYLWILAGASTLYLYRLPLLGFNISVYRIALIGGLLVLGWHVVTGKIRLTHRQIILGIGCLLVALVALTELLRPVIAPSGYRNIANHLANLSLVLLLVVSLKDSGRLHTLIRALVVTSAVPAVISLLAAHSVTIPLGDELPVPLPIGQPSSYRLSGAFYDADVYAIYLCMVAGLGIYYLLFRARDTVVAMLSAATLPLLFFTQSRTGFAGMAVVLTVTLLFAKNRRLKWCLVTGVIALLAALLAIDWFAGTGVIQHVLDPASISDRLPYIEAGIAAFRRDIWFGSGTEAMRIGDLYGPSPSAHVVYLSLLAKFGILGFSVYAGFLLTPLVGITFRPSRYRRPARFLVTVLLLPLLVMYLAYDVMEFFELQYFAFGIMYAVLSNQLMSNDDGHGIVDHEGPRVAAPRRN